MLNLKKEEIENLQTAGYKFEKGKNGLLATNETDKNYPHVKFFTAGNSRGAGTVFTQKGTKNFDSHEDAAKFAFKTPYNEQL